MSSAYSFILPTTGAISLVDYYSSVIYQQSIISADSHRALLRDSLKRAKRDSDNPDILGVVKALKDYLPFLYDIIRGDAIETNSQKLAVSWRLPFRVSAPLVESPKTEIPDLEFERGMILLCYSLALIHLGDSKGKAIQWKEATAYFLQGQSILNHLIANPPRLKEIPYDLQLSTLSSISTMISGSVHLLILYKSLEEEREQSSGPATAPMRSVASAALLSRVAIYASEKFSSALQLISASSKKFGVIEAYQSWLRQARVYSLAAGQRYIAIEESKRGNVGKAIGILNLALEGIDGGKVKAILKRDKDGLLKPINDLKVAINELISLYSAENKTILFQPIPKPNAIEKSWPSGREVVSQKPQWIPPTHDQTTQSSADGGYY
jgi:hypothetical protein